MDAGQTLASVPRPRGGHPAVQAQWGDGHGGAARLASTPCPRASSRDMAEEGEKEKGKGADRRTPHVSGCDCVLGRRRARWAERWDGPLGLLAGGEKRRWSDELQEPG
jgi:hypothetical protein